VQIRDVRRAERIPVHLSAELVHQDGTLQADLVDLSLTGAFVELASPFADGTRLRLRLPLPGPEPLVAEATVVRTGTCARFIAHPRVENLMVSVSGNGLLFDELEDGQAERLQEYLDSVVDT